MHQPHSPSPASSSKHHHRHHHHNSHQSHQSNNHQAPIAAEHQHNHHNGQPPQAVSGAAVEPHLAHKPSSPGPFSASGFPMPPAYPNAHVNGGISLVTSRLAALPTSTNSLTPPGSPRRHHNSGSPIHVASASSKRALVPDASLPGASLSGNNIGDYHQVQHLQKRLPPSSSAVSPANLPDLVLEHLFSFLDLASLRACSLVCKSWYRLLNDENNDVWRLHCVRRLAQEALQSSELLTALPTYKSKLRAFCHAWNPDDCSRNIYVKPSGFTLHRNPVAQSTDGGRGKIGFRHGRHAWEVIWEGPLGTVAVIGIATTEAPNQCHGYVALLGSNDQSWGWNLVDNHLLHNGDSQGNYPQLNNAPKYQVGERIRVILDCDDNTLAFERNYEFLGVAFRGLPDKRLYPSISAVYGNTEVSMVYVGSPLDG